MNAFSKKLLTGLGISFGSAFLYSKIRDNLRYISFQGKVVLISGGSRGLGLLLAQEFASAGASIAILARDKDELRRAQNIIQSKHPKTLVHTYECDCTQSFHVQETVSKVRQDFGGIDVLVNNAGIISSMPIQNATEEDFAESLATHFWGPYYLIQAVVPHMTRGSRIVNISSIGGLVPIPHLAAYCTGKFALTGYSRSLRNELMKDGIYVCTICPSLMRTGSVDHAKFKGQARKEYTIFSLTASLPLISQSAERSARKIIKAAHFGQAELVISLNAKLAQLLDSHFPGLFSDIMSLANYLLPGPTDNLDMSLEGKDAHTFISDSILTQSSHSAALRNNEGQIRHT